MAYRGRLRTRDNTARYSDILACPLCNDNPESCEHLFFKCRESKLVWDSIKQWLGSDRNPTTLISAIKWCEEKCGGSAIKRKARGIALAGTIFYIWFGRNKKIHDDKEFKHEELVHLIKTHTYKMLYSLFPEKKVLDHISP